MAKNRRPEAEPQPQPASSSEDEEGEEEESSSEESEEQQRTTSTPVSKKTPAPKKPVPTPQSSDDDDSESESEAESDSPPDTTRRPDPNIKPITSKPMQDTPKSTKKPRSEPTSATPASKPSAAVKRPAVESENNGGDRESKRAKKKKKDLGIVNDETTPKKNGEDSKKQLFQRLWSKDDEIVILKGLIDYREKKGADPMADLNAFQDFIKKSLLHMGDVSKSQFSTKVRRLKKKYQNNVKRAKDGQDRSFSNPHEQMSYDLSKKIWGSEANNGVEVENGKGSTGKGKKNQEVLPKVDELGSPDGVKEGTRGEVEPNTSAKRALRFDGSIGGSSLEAILEDGLELIGGTQKLELEEKWRQFRVEEMELHVKRLDLLREQSKLLLETLKSKRH